MPHPNLRPLVGDRFAAVCGKCLRPSPPVSAPGEEQAWAELQRAGWTAVEAAPGQSQVLCALCTLNPPEAGSDRPQARRGRPRR